MVHAPMVVAETPRICVKTAFSADFDFTLTKFWVNGRRGSSCHMVVSDSGLFSEEYHETTAKLREHYYPMEVT